MARVLVTGASGFIGGHLVEALVRRGDRVRCFVRRSSQVNHLDGLDIEFVFGDLDDPSHVERAVAGSDVVYHLAGLTSAFRAARLHAVNGIGTQRVVAACAQQTTPPVHVLVSSVAAAGPAQRGALRQESEPPRPVSNYGRSKRAGEAAAAERAWDVPTTIVRPGIVFGERNAQCLPIFQTITRMGVHPVVAFRAPPLSVIYIHDLVEILLRAAERGTRLPPPNDPAAPAGAGYYFACRDEYPTYVEFGRQISQALGRSRVLVLPMARPFSWAAAGINELLARVRRRPDSFNIDKIREASAPSWACSPAAVQRELGFAPQASLDEQLQATVAWYREHGWLPRKSRRESPSVSPDYSPPSNIGSRSPLTSDPSGPHRPA